VASNGTERELDPSFDVSFAYSIFHFSRNVSTTQVPQDLESLSKEELVNLLRSVVSERESGSGGSGKVNGGDGGDGDDDDDALEPTGVPIPGLPTNSALKASNLLPFLPAPPRAKAVPQYNVAQAKTRIAETMSSLIKKRPHHWKGRPTTELTESVPSLEAARELFKGFEDTAVNKTARSYRWQLTGEQVIEWLNCPKYIHPVKFEGKVVCTIGQPAYVYAFAGYDSMLAKFEQGTNTLTLKVKTFTAGTGNIPGCKSIHCIPFDHLPSLLVFSPVLLLSFSLQLMSLCFCAMKSKSFRGSFLYHVGEPNAKAASVLFCP